MLLLIDYVYIMLFLVQFGVSLEKLRFLLVLVVLCNQMSKVLTESFNIYLIFHISQLHISCYN